MNLQTDQFDFSKEQHKDQMGLAWQQLMTNAGLARQRNDIDRTGLGMNYDLGLRGLDQSATGMNQQYDLGLRSSDLSRDQYETDRAFRWDEAQLRRQQVAQMMSQLPTQMAQELMAAIVGIGRDSESETSSFGVDFPSIDGFL